MWLCLNTFLLFSFIIFLVFDIYNYDVNIFPYYILYFQLAISKNITEITDKQVSKFLILIFLLNLIHRTSGASFQIKWFNVILNIVLTAIKNLS